MTFYVLGCVTAGAVTGALFGAVGWAAQGIVWGHGQWTLLAIAAAGAIGSLVDGGILRWPLPTIRRQVDDEWLYKYRGWFYGLAFGVQLGCGVATIVTTASVYVAYLTALLTGSWSAGALIGGTLGAARGMAQLAARRVRSPEDLLRLDARMQVTGRSSKVRTSVAEAILAAAALVGWVVAL